MRYKFRGKRKDSGEWVYGDFLKPTDYHFCIRERISQVTHYVESETVGQFTGLVIREREVYQGDLFQYRDGSDSCHFEIVWDKERLAWDYKRIEDGELMYNHYDFGLLEDSEYIGTIHEDEQ